MSKDKFQNPAVIINMDSGSTDDIRVEICEALSRVFPRFDNTVAVGGSDLEAAISNKIDAGSDLMIVYGGDGTALTAARLCAPTNVPLLPLPGGTMNVLHRKIYSTDRWQNILEQTLPELKTAWHPAGFLNDNMFLVAAIIGTPARLAEAREAARENDVIGTTQSVVSTMLALVDDDTFEYFGFGHNDKTQTSNLLQVTCPGMNDYAIQDEKFEIVAATITGYADIANLAMTALATNWRNYDGVKRRFGRAVKIDGEGVIDILLDGEGVDESFPFNIRLEAKGFRVITPI